MYNMIDKDFNVITICCDLKINIRSDEELNRKMRKKSRGMILFDYL